MSARIVRLPQTVAGRALLRECLPFISNWCWPDGAPIDDDDFDAQAAEIERLMALPCREAR